jgi:cellulose synthase/poly-beta-1,6-N-acetylglucosamine synthase-like glycosyltransferase
VTTTVDVAVPCYRYGNFLRECVESVLSQENVDVRVLIIDDCSPDNTSEVGEKLAQSDRRVEYRRHPVNKGHIATYNEGIDWASANLFLLLSADDYVSPGALSRASMLFDTNPAMSFVFGNATLVFDDKTYEIRAPLGGSLTNKTKILSCLDFVKAMSGQNIVPTPTAVVRTNAQKQVGGYCHALPHAGDMAMWLRLAAEGPVGFVNETQAVYRMHARNMSRSYSTARLPDVQQRQAAIEHFLEHSAAKLVDPALSRKILCQSLGRNAAYQASAAFNDGDLVAMRQLSKLAKELHPGVWFTGPWLKLVLNRMLGQHAWRILRSALGA